ncbi:MAG: serine hydrolase [Pseudomonadota bacterium]
MTTPAYASRSTLIRDLYAGSLTPDRLMATLKTADTLFPAATVARSAVSSKLPVASRQLQSVEVVRANRRYDLVDYLAYNRIAGLLVLKDGAIVREDYELGLAPDDRFASFSLAKSVCSTLYGVALQDGLLGSLEAPISRYLPALAHSAYREVSLRQVLEMTSGVGWDETYTDPASQRRQFLELQIAGHPDSLLRMMSELPRVRTPGSVFNYNTGETFLAGAALEAAIGAPLARYLHERVWSPAGMQDDARWWLESPDGAAIGGSGLSATLRDYARFARFVLEDGCIGTTRVVREGWFEQATTRIAANGERRDYGYQWWLPEVADGVHDGAFLAMGIFGQRIYLHPRRRLAIIALCARPKPSDAHVVEDSAFFAAVARALD